MKIDIKKIPNLLDKKFIPVILIVMSIILFVFMRGSVAQKQKVFKEGQLAEETVRANKTIENKSETEEKQRLAIESISPEYTYDGTKADAQGTLVSKMFEMVEKTNSDAEKTYNDNVSKAKDKDKKTVNEVSVEEKIPMLKSQFEKLNPNDLAYFQSYPDSFYEQLFSYSSSDLKRVKEESKSVVSEVMNRKIRNSNLQTEKQNAKERLQYIDITTSMRQAINSIIDKSIVVNEVANEKATEQMKENAKNNVQPVMIYQGEIIVREAEQIDSKAMEKIKILGLANQSTSVFPMLALVLTLVLQLSLIYFISKTEDDEDTVMKNTIFYVCSILISIFFMKLLYLFQKDTFSNVSLLFPSAFVPVILTMFMSRKWGLLIAMFQSIFSIFIFYNLAGTTTLLVITLFYAFSGCIATFLVRKRIESQIKSAFFLLIIVPFVFIAILTAYQGLDFGDSKTLTSLFIASAGGIFSFILSIGLHPYIELLFTDDSVIILNELSNPNQPLLKRLLQEAPGTYHHSMMVASLSANAVAEIGGRSLLTRVACYYHDIGKIKHANFFVENLPDGVENPHNFLLPSDSKEIIFSHVTEGVKILEEAKMPQFVIDVCQQHHGTTLMKYFYIKEQERNADTMEEMFRYPGPKPQSREAGVINIADSAEAAVRAMDHPTNQKISEFVHGLIRSRLEDGQLNESGLTLNEIAIIEKSIVDGLCSTFHSRIKYPKMKSEAEKMKQEQEGRKV
ncbi:MULTISPECIES: HDIG domain-containing metalloprotein [Vagococcus]|uniref:Membrane protein containing HD superfamily hydrolase domain, YQFF ortholog n=1 Tax=Vagococcus fluvialis bH819 TaxID=1255619 RepID=A0A1X6WN88_9ENTE|nr:MULTISPECIES: HDIG domain-containing metalloprotein [Vagococcus]SLM85735.1 Membrane protein containing HD superfamily hydrolase domain, YQFF ortholog [Vagococcus fluvialis bH819]HCM90157.1 HDIG domain-containing protein [Vagococcus sp.]